MDTALIVVIAAVALLALFLIARQGWARSQDKRRQKAGELRVESTREQERARRAEIEAERRHESAAAAERRAERIDPDAETAGRRRFSFFGRDRDSEDEETERETPERETSEEGRPGLWDRLVHR